MSQYPRILIAATSSGSGKTLITCGILQAFKNRGFEVASFKCGPDYIDPMFHSTVIGAKSRNLDTFFAGPDLTNYLFAKNAAGMDLSVMEGVMGYYDGVGGVTVQAGAYDLARTTHTPAVLVVDCRGMSLSIVALLKGFLTYREDSQIQGVILNRLSPMLYEDIKKQVETELNIKVYGYVPVVKEYVIESRHLGLILPEEVDALGDKVKGLASVMEKTLDLDGLIALAHEAPEPAFHRPALPTVSGNPLIAVARDSAFCFYYQDNLDLLESMGARLVEFSPLRDAALPPGIQGLLLGGGYPELFAKELSENKGMLESVKAQIEQGLPCMAECGGFMYLHQSMEGMEGISYPMAGVIPGEIYRTGSLRRFGYIDLTALQDQMAGPKGTSIKGHEFHYFESTQCGESFLAEKPGKKRSWNCIHGTNRLLAGFPHLFYYSNFQVPYAFLRKCQRYGGKK